MPDNNWTLISGSTPQDYTDTAVFEVNPDTKQIALITGQALVAGEKDSQYISFLMPRYWDGIDISDKSFNIEYALAGTYYGTSEAVNAEMTTEQVRFGWIVPETACAISGTLLFVLKITSEGYTLKTQIAEHPVFKTIRVEDVVPEPTKEAWYRAFQTRVDSAISEAETAVKTAQTTLTQVEAAAQLAQTAAQDAQTAQETVEAASQSAQTSAQVAQVSQEAAEAAAQTASDKATEAQGYAQSAEGARDDALAAQAAAETAQQSAETAQTGAETAQTAAQTAQGRAEQALADTRAEIAADSSTTTLSVTRVISTTYMTDAQFARIVARKKRNMLFLLFNAEFTSAGLDATSGFVTIATISGWNALSETFLSIPKQTDGSKVMTLSVRSNGEVQVHSPQAAISGWFRGYVCVPYSG